MRLGLLHPVPLAASTVGRRWLTLDTAKGSENFPPSRSELNVIGNGPLSHTETRQLSPSPLKRPKGHARSDASSQLGRAASRLYTHIRPGEHRNLSAGYKDEGIASSTASLLKLRSFISLRSIYALFISHTLLFIAYPKSYTPFQTSLPTCRSHLSSLPCCWPPQQSS